MYLFFDTETTGLPRDRSAPLSDLDNWPRLVQVAWLLYDDRENHIGGRSAIIKPLGFSIPADATKVHGITTARARREGAELAPLLRDFASAIERSRVLVAHNMSFDEKVIAAEFLRTRIKTRLLDTDRFCTMRASTEFCAIPGRHGYKWPTLSELHACLFASAPGSAHTAESDVQACARCFFELRRRKLIKLPGR
ncbi:MAG: 3'-5' exonuclease [Acidobacteria bacterium]|nr:3'-5' exonuclease [Acidobacteriota bacterium]